MGWHKKSEKRKKKTRNTIWRFIVRGSTPWRTTFVHSIFCL